MIYSKAVSSLDKRVHGGKFFNKTNIRNTITRTTLNIRAISNIQMEQSIDFDESSSKTEISKGGYGKIYIVQPMNDLPPLALKVTPTPNRLQEDHIQNNEIGYLQRLQGSHNIVKLYKYDVSESETRIWMELCNKGSIEDELAMYPYQSIPEDRVRTIMKAVFQTLAQCHDQSIVHGDIKPGNFLNTDDGRIVAIDFGNASSVEEFDHMKGTPHYMAPEQLNSETCTKSDMWSAGVMMYRLLSNRFPFDDRQNPYQPSLYAIWREIFSKDLTFRRTIWNQVSIEGKELLSHLLEKDPSKRISAIDALNHPWLKSIDNKTKDVKHTENARYIRYQMYPELKKDMLRYVSNYYNMTPQDLSSSPNNSLRNSSEAKQILQKYVDEVLPEKIEKICKNTHEISHIKCIIGDRDLKTFESIYRVWMKPNLPTYAFQC